VDQTAYQCRTENCACGRRKQATRARVPKTAPQIPLVLRKDRSTVPIEQKPRPVPYEWKTDYSGPCSVSQSNPHLDMLLRASALTRPPMFCEICGKRSRWIFCNRCSSNVRRESYKAVRKLALTYLGGRCACCKSERNLEIDHIKTESSRLGKNYSRRGLRRELSHETLIRAIRGDVALQLLCKGCHRSKTNDEYRKQPDGTYKATGECHHQRARREFKELRLGLDSAPTNGVET
jgi:hypothetical protein